MNKISSKNIKYALTLTALLSSATQSTNPLGFKEAALAKGAFALGYSIYAHLTRIPTDNAVRYDATRLKDTLIELKNALSSGDFKRIKNATHAVYHELHLYYEDGLIGHPSKTGSPRFEDAKGYHEIPAIDSKGIYGWIGDRVDPAVKAAKTTGGIIGLGYVAHQIDRGTVSAIVRDLTTNHDLVELAKKK